MKKKLSCLFLALAFSAFANVFAQTTKIPGTHWTFDTHTMYDAIITGELYINGESMKNAVGAEYFEIGAFCGDECRGSYLPDDVQLPFYSGYAYQMQVYSDNASGEEIVFRIYDHLTETELDVVCNSTIVFSPNAVYGDLMNPFQLDFTLNVTTSYEITVAANPVEGGAVHGGGIYDDGSLCTLEAEANEGYDFVSWTQDGQVVATEPSFSFIVREEANFVANFEEIIIINTYDVVVTANPANYGTVEGGGTYDEGEICTIKATPEPGRIFVGWTENGAIVSENQEYSFVVNADHSFVANFDVDGIESYEAEEFVFYPNPVNEKIFIENAGNISRYEIYTVTGSMVMSGVENHNKIEINVAFLQSGAYFIKVKDEKNVKNIRFIKK